MNSKIQDKRDDIKTSICNATLSSIPYIGPTLSEILIQYPEKRYQKRLNRFIELWMETLNNLSFDIENIDLEYLNTEEFEDLFILFIEKIQRANNEEKLKRLAAILTNEISQNSNTSLEFKETFLDIVMKINEEQIIILNEYRKFKGLGFLDDKEEDGLALHRYPQYYHLEDARYLFFVQDLISKSLLYDDSIGRYNASPFNFLDITDFGWEFLNFIEGSGKGTDNVT